MRPIAVVAFGGNAILSAGDDGSFQTQMEKAKGTCREMLAILHRGFELVLVHGNGPQVGNLLLQFEKARDIIPVPPLDVAVATSQGLLGHMLEIAMRTVLEEDKMEREVATLLTQVVVDPADPAYRTPTKPIGPFYTRDEAERFRREEGWAVVEDAGRGYRRVVCSPKPLKVLPLHTIKHLLQNETVVIACGGGGIPVNYGTRAVVGTEGVIDKDATSALLAYNLGAELFIILTGVDKVCLDFGKPTQRAVDVMTAAEARRWLAEGQFPPGSMGPKIEGAVEYVEKGGKEALIAHERHVVKALREGLCTRIVP
ncbi:MAG TPA: carbamate kinase [Anaeromyxobacteraceae bacterium]|nr:carbamate kinase [Anaeromyxobacteraceae bacterium]